MSAASTRSLPTVDLSRCPPCLGAGPRNLERAAKFSLFKPAEEMVYSTLDEDSRTKGKAAVDVLGAQIGKTGGSFMQQGLILTYGSIIAALPVLVCCHSAIALGWLIAVNALAARRASQLDSEIREGVEKLEI